jgi:hypothetical protein
MITIAIWAATTIKSIGLIGVYVQHRVVRATNIDQPHLSPQTTVIARQSTIVHARPDHAQRIAMSHPGAAGVPAV